MTTHWWKEIRRTTGYRATDHPSGPVPLLPSRADGVTRRGARRAPATREEHRLMYSVLMPRSAPEAGTRPAGEQGAAGLGVVGLGAFGRFCLEAYVTMPGVRVVAIADPDADALAAGITLAPQALAYADPALLLGLPEVEVVAICAAPWPVCTTPSIPVPAPPAAPSWSHSRRGRRASMDGCPGA